MPYIAKPNTRGLSTLIGTLIRVTVYHSAAGYHIYEGFLTKIDDGLLHMNCLNTNMVTIDKLAMQTKIETWVSDNSTG